jgi:COP9 signalosome complex subunit 8
MCWKYSVASHQYIRELKSTCRPPARYALTRLPDKLAVHPLSQALFGLLAATSERNYHHIYSRAESLFHHAQQPDFPDEKLGEVIASMTKAFVGS